LHQERTAKGHDLDDLYLFAREKTESSQFGRKSIVVHGHLLNEPAGAFAQIGERARPARRISKRV
jgi:hypothetical protein